MKKNYSEQTKLVFLVFFISVILWGCQKDIFEQEKYKRPDWLEGKIFTQIQSDDDLKTFKACLERTGYDSILNASGSFTVFAPTEDAFSEFLLENSYDSISDISAEELKLLVEYQILYNAWSREQFQILDVGGWIDPNDELSKPRAYKHKTLYREENKTYPATRKGNMYHIVEQSQSSESKIAFTQSNKFAPFFFQKFFSAVNLRGSDFEYYFNRPFDGQKLYFADAEFGEGIPAENGFIYKTDKVISPLLNAEELLEKDYSDYSYSEFLSLIHQFSEFSENLEETYKQPGADQGLEVDILYNLDYPDLVFNIHNELTGNTNNHIFTYRDHHGLLAPTNHAIESFLNEYLSDWDDIESLPTTIKKILVNSHMTERAVYTGDLNYGFLNGERDSVRLNDGDIIQKTYGSNCSFLGLNQMIVPRVIKSICRPMYITRQYQTMMYAFEQTKVMSALKKPNVNYALYLPKDAAISGSGDSSLIRIIDNAELDSYHFEAYNRGLSNQQRIKNEYLKGLLLNHVGASVPRGVANKEFIRTLGGNYIVVNNSEGTVSGSAPTTYGYQGDSTITVRADPYLDLTDNGKVYITNSLFDFSNGSNFYGLFLTSYSKFFNLLSEAGLYDPNYYTFSFLTEGEFYTMFIPSDEALNEYGVDDLSEEELRKFLKYHIVAGEIIFTDGNMPEALYPTLRIDESSTEYISNYNELHIRPKPDVIQILDKNGEVYAEIPEQGARTNKLISYDSNRDSDSKWDFIITGVAHTIDTVLIKGSLQAN